MECLLASVTATHTATHHTIIGIMTGGGVLIITTHSITLLIIIHIIHIILHILLTILHIIQEEAIILIQAVDLTLADQDLMA